MALIVAGERSGVGKTTVTLALLAYLKKCGLKVQSFKVGPDYIDPMFHRHVTGRSCRNLDPVLTSEAYVQQCFGRHTQNATYALIEGVMGLFDGAAGREDYASTAHIARLLDCPILLVVDCSRMSHSVAALVHGYRSFDPRIKLAGVILNRVGSDRHLDLLKSALEPLNISILGVLRRQDNITIPDRHLGLVPTAELNNLNCLIDRLSHLAKTCFDWHQLIPLLESNQPHTPYPTPHTPYPTPHTPRIAIAQDSAFSFYYADNLELLQELGAELISWSPLTDPKLPEGIQGLYFGGGFPEMFAEQLAANESARNSVYAAIQAGIPTYAECGGLMYLSRSIQTFEGQVFSMVGTLPTDAVMGSRLVLGYRKAIAQQTTSIVTKDQTIWGHEFHRSHLTQPPQPPLFSLHPTPYTSPPTPEGWHCHNLHASYLHLHWGATPEIPKRFLQQCTKVSQLCS